MTDQPTPTRPWSSAFADGYGPIGTAVVPGLPCIPPWIPNYGCCDGWDDWDEGVQTRANALAWSTIRTLSAGLVGNCPVTVRPCLAPPCDACSGAWMTPTLVAGQWHNIVCGTPRCSCARLCEIDLGTQVAEIVEVLLDGVIVPLSHFRVDNHRLLVREDGACWPSCQDMGAPLGSAGTLGITYIPGIVPDEAGLWAVGTLACEYAKACSGGKCRLPTGVTAVARQGVSFTLMTGMFAGGMTGIREVDAYLYAINPNALKIPPRVWSPDLPSAQHRYQTWP